jgi:hypothetical protein
LASPNPVFGIIATGPSMSGEAVSPVIDVAIIGAGPYGPSIAAHLQARGIEFRIFGKPMRNWLHSGLMIEPTVGRVDGQEEVATHHGANIPLAAYLREIGAAVSPAEVDPPPVVWRDSFSHWRTDPNDRISDAYWRLDGPMPAVFSLIGQSMGFIRKTVRRMLSLPAIVVVAKSRARQARNGVGR